MGGHPPGREVPANIWCRYAWHRWLERRSRRISASSSSATSRDLHLTANLAPPWRKFSRTRALDSDNRAVHLSSWWRHVITALETHQAFTRARSTMSEAAIAVLRQHVATRLCCRPSNVRARTPAELHRRRPRRSRLHGKLCRTVQSPLGVPQTPACRCCTLQRIGELVVVCHNTVRKLTARGAVDMVHHPSDRRVAHAAWLGCSGDINP